MLFQPQNMTLTGGSYTLPKDAAATAHPCLDKDVLKEFWHNFSLRSSALTVTAADTLTFSVGHAPVPTLDGCAYAINVTKEGVALCGESEQALIHGFMTLLSLFRAVDTGDGTAAVLDRGTLRDRALIGCRMVHYCIFPETELWELQRFVRLCGVLKYTHIVLEFWGTLQYDCLRELAWSHGFTKAQVRPIVEEAKALGLEVIPMFNHWGHASAGRVMHGKHVVLDQDPTLQPYFSEDGWCWNIHSPKVRGLLRQVRTELIELCGEGRYFHIGCDEAYNFEFTPKNTAALVDFINEISDELSATGRRAIMWGDMLLYPHAHYNKNNRYTCNAPTPEIEAYFLDKLSRRIVMADWQYDTVEFPVETVSVFKDAGFDCLLCPWDKGGIPQVSATLHTVKDRALLGYMHTTWHTLSSGTPYVTLMGAGGFADVSGLPKIAAYPHTAALLRRVMPACGDYERAGWSHRQIDFRW